MSHIESRKRERLEGPQKVAILKRYLVDKTPISDLCDEYGIKDAMATVGCRAMIADGERRTRQAKPLTRHGGYVEEFTDRLYRLAEADLVDVFVLDLGIVGFTRWRKLMPELVKAGIKASPHLWMWTPRTYYCAQPAAGVGNVCIIEGIPGQAPGIDYSAYKIRILREADRCTRPGQLGALLRREGLYSSHLTTSGSRATARRWPVSATRCFGSGASGSCAGGGHGAPEPAGLADSWNAIPCLTCVRSTRCTEA